MHTEEMIDKIREECNKMKNCGVCPLKIADKKHCFKKLSNSEIKENYSIMFGNEEQKMLNIDKYRDEIIEIGLELGLANDHAALAYYCRMKGKVTIAFDEVIRWLFQEYKEPIQLTQFEYDLLRTNDQPHNKKIKDFKTYIHMKNVGHYKGVTDWNMTIDDILDNCEVVEYVD